MRTLEQYIGDEIEKLKWALDNGAVQPDDRDAVEARLQAFLDVQERMAS